MDVDSFITTLPSLSPLYVSNCSSQRPPYSSPNESKYQLGLILLGSDWRILATAVTVLGSL